VPSRDVFLKPPAPYFGLTTPQAPWSRSELNSLAAKAGAHPTMIQFFVNWTQEFRPDAVSMCYSQHALPLLSWEPWAGVKHGQSQPTFALRRITSGAYDAYITKFARGIRDQRWPVVLSFAHEMNGTWYPWSESRSGNRPGEYVQAWRHVHDIFTTVGATNVIWVWSPNIVRAVPLVSLADLYPGDSYVDWSGMVGYDYGEPTAGEVFDPTIARIREFTRKPLLIAETAAEPGPVKAAWTASLFPWLRKHRDGRRGQGLAVQRRPEYPTGLPRRDRGVEPRFSDRLWVSGGTTCRYCESSSWHAQSAGSLPSAWWWLSQSSVVRSSGVGNLRGRPSGGRKAR